MFISTNKILVQSLDSLAFAKVELDPNESKTVTFEIRDDMFEVYDSGFKKIEGSYGLLIGRNSSDIVLGTEIRIDGEKAAFEALKGSWYETLIGAPSREEWEKLMGHKVVIEAEPKKGHFTMDNSCLEMKDHSLMMKIQYLITKNIIGKPYPKEERNMNNPAYKMILTAATDCPLRAVVISSDGMMKDSLARGMLEMANGHYIKGIMKMIKG